jgi:hypothetical protein
MTDGADRSSGVTDMKWLKRLLLVAIALQAAACSHIEPWVKPYERDRLADPIMSWGRDPVSIAYLSHVRDAREGSRGASGTAGGGCGCN